VHILRRVAAVLLVAGIATAGCSDERDSTPQPGDIVDGQCVLGNDYTKLPECEEETITSEECAHMLANGKTIDDCQPTPPGGGAGAKNTTRGAALVLRDVLGANAEACSEKDAIVHEVSAAVPGFDVERLCYQWGATVITGLDVESATAQRDPGKRAGWCVAPTLTSAGARRLRAYIEEQPVMTALPLVSHGKVLISLGMNSNIRSGECWITSDGMSEASARVLARELS
jgi:hypothetical protein